MIRIALVVGIACLARQIASAEAPATQGDAMAFAKVDHDLPHYQRVSKLTGTIRSMGSPTTGALISAWADEFQKVYPDVVFDLKGGTSAAVAPALISKNPPNLGAMSRPMTGGEMATFTQRFGYPPTAIRVAVNAMVIFVSKNNPCPGLSLEMLAAIYAQPGPDQKQILTWGQTGLHEESWATERILPYTLDETRGETGFFKSRVMPNREFRFDAQTELTSSAVVEDCAVDRGAIGYSSIIFRTRRARALAIQGADGKFYEPTYDNCLSQRYPLADFLYIYINRSPDRPLDRATQEFMAFACCQLGQETASREGAFPLTPQLAQEQLHAIGK